MACPKFYHPGLIFRAIPPRIVHTTFLRGDGYSQEKVPRRHEILGEDYSKEQFPAYDLLLGTSSHEIHAPGRDLLPRAPCSPARKAPQSKTPRAFYSWEYLPQNPSLPGFKIS